MSNIRSLTLYRSEKRKEWLQHHHERLEAIVRSFVLNSMDTSFRQIHQEYQVLCLNLRQESWDYEELREIIQTQLEGPQLEALYSQLSSTHWFDRALLSKDVLLDYCVNMFITQSEI